MSDENRTSRKWWQRLGQGVCTLAGGHFLARPVHRCPFCKAAEERS